MSTEVNRSAWAWSTLHVQSRRGCPPRADRSRYNGWGAKVPAGVLLAVVLVLSGCSSTPPDTSPVTRTATAAVPSALAPATSGIDYGEDDPTAEPAPTWDETARAAALEHARATMTAFARPDLPQPQWWQDLARLLTLSAQDAYSPVDPAEVPTRQVTGQAVLTDETSAWLARVNVPTDVGTYTLLLAREDATSPWRTQTITPPAELSGPAGPTGPAGATGPAGPVGR